MSVGGGRHRANSKKWSERPISESESWRWYQKELTPVYNCGVSTLRLARTLTEQVKEEI